MTTHNTHHEQSDVDTSVVSYPSAPETTVDSAPSEPGTPTTADAAESASSIEEPGKSTKTSEEAHHVAIKETSASPVSDDTATQQADVPDTVEPSASPEIPADPVQEQHTAATSAEPVSSTSEVASQEAQTQEQAESEIPAQPVDTEPASGTAFAQVIEESVHITYEETVTLDKAKTEEVRPFTDFIEEFRQAEAARHVTLHDSPVDAFSLLSPSSPITDLSGSEQTAAQRESTISSAEEIIPPLTVDTDMIFPQEQENVQPIVTTTPNIPSEEVRLTQETTSTETQGPQTETPRPTPPERAVSPLLRPATRLRIPRHSVRHQREEQVAETPTSAASTVQPATNEAPVAPEAPRPTRRYRFDRPAAKGATPAIPTTASTTQPRSEETHPVTPSLLGDAAAQTKELAKEPATAQIAPPDEQQSRKQNGVQEAAATESANAGSPAAAETGRRRHSHKEQPASMTTPPSPVSSVEATAAKAEPQASQEEIAPEDLPPLEYSELQKANPRRRRRHRSSTTTPSSVIAPASPASNNGTADQAAATAPLNPPLVPPQPTLNGNLNYTIVSGYTVNQMNQGNDTTGPFMGPEPSPARGSVFSREGRTTRGEIQRASVPGPVYPPVRSNDGGLNSASMAQFANIVSQAIQLQTDRMVAELRHANQAPTNVSVSLPPFPSTERVGVFVDVANLLYSARTLRIAVDFGKLLDFLRGNRRLVRAQAYCPTSPQPGDEQMFLQAVKGLGYRITTKNYKTFSSGAKKADLDLDLCMDVVRLVDGRAVDCIVLVSGDSDFMPMLDYCSDHGVRVEVAAFDEAMSATLRQSCDLFVNLSMLEEIRA